jgi:quercetin dioxygenase-like cupin family protein
MWEWKMKLILGVALFTGVALMTASIAGLHAQQDAVPSSSGKVDQIVLEALSDAAGKEVWMATASFPAGAKVPRHFHYGDEIHYVLEGSWTSEVDGQPPLTKKAGEWDMVKREVVHSGTVGNTPVKLLVIVIGDKGKPTTTAAPAK